MTKEEKAKAYDEMVRLLSNWYKNETDIGIIDHISAICPELKENEDERIRKDIISHLKYLGKYCQESIPNVNEWITWLEKQGEQKTTIEQSKDIMNEVVDLGLPSKTLWSKCNLGAKKESDFGLYYQWGDTEGYTVDEAHQFSWDTYKYGLSWDNITKYNKNDGKLVLDNEDDPVYVATDGKMKSPTKEQLQELIYHTDHNWVEIDGVKGMTFTNKSDYTKYIFIPATGYCDDSCHNDVGSWGYVWSLSRDYSYPGSAWYMHFCSGNISMNHYYRFYGYNVRGVANKPLK